MIEVIKENGSGYSFLLKSESGHALLRSVQFSSEAEAKQTARNLYGANISQHIIERKTNHEGKFLFTLKNSDGQIVGHSQLYSSEAGLENGIKNLKNRILALGSSSDKL